MPKFKELNDRVSLSVCQFVSLSVCQIKFWESVESFRNAFLNPEFQKHISAYPDSTVVSPHLFKKLSASDCCVA